MRLRSIALLAIFALLFTSCGASRSDRQPAEEEGGSYGSGVNLDIEQTPPPDQPAQAQQPRQRAPSRQAPQGGASQPQAGQQSQPVPHSEPSQPATLRAYDHGETGRNALVYLRKDIPKMVIEINAVNGWEPHPAALSRFRERMTAVLDKPGGIDIRVKTFTTNRSSYTMDDVRRLEEAQRREFSRGDTAVLHILYLNGRIEDRSALGVAYQASSLVIFPEFIDSISTPAAPREAIERAVLVHEAGHALGLVNLGYRSPRDYEDEQHPGHSIHQDDVMYYAVETISVANVFRGGPPDEFSADARADLEDRKAGRL